MLTIDFPEEDLSIKSRAGENVSAWVELPSVNLDGRWWISEHLVQLVADSDVRPMM